MRMVMLLKVKSHIPLYHHREYALYTYTCIELQPVGPILAIKSMSANEEITENLEIQAEYELDAVK
jgi:hypothetical protein